jgi:type II secretory pathway pseudopilin PulG
LSTRGGFTLAELLIAGALVLLLMTGLAAVVDPSHATARAQAAATDVRLRLRAASEAVAAELHGAGSGPSSGVYGRPLGGFAPAVLPLRLGSRGDPPGVARPDALTVISTAGVGAAAELTSVFVPGVGAAQIAASPGCPSGDPSCGVRVGVSVVIVNERGQWDLFTVATVTGASLGLLPRGAISGRPFPAGSRLVPVNVVCFFLRHGTAAEGLQLMTGDGDQWDLPLVDHLTGLTFDLLGDPSPPRLGSAGGTPGAATYGPNPPPPGDDTLTDDWPAGENCTFLAVAGGQSSRLPILSAGAGAALVPLPASMLTDGPWCPDGSAANRYDADLLRVRAVRVTIQAEAASASARGADTRLFLHPGSSRDRSGVASERKVVIDVVSRALQAGR